ncbi:uncharacterized protein B0P05DRAFT_558178 [Gilbertella persicaria]|uniref:uncharacterized protein n=1 Tax=Gilbertella persicaria TaxID=101096 RepID=UPI002220405A|nr:uncharacterized protein B0P05DRAFT_558178 [Gilbertella persicaria]KAI8059940.1 hypothetical protein B0P05DRAFT_558178 [Gilbertella persicaria]
MSQHPHSALHIYQFLSSLHDHCSDQDTFEAILLSLRTPRFTAVSNIAERWRPTLLIQAPSLVQDFELIISSAAKSHDYDTLLMRVAEHFPLIYRVSCFLENDLQLELFVRCLCLDSTTPVTTQEVQATVQQFLQQLPQDSQEYIQAILKQDSHGYYTQTYDGFLDLDRVYEIVNDPYLFDQFMAILQTNTNNGVIWSQTIQEVYELVHGRSIWEQLAPLLQQAYSKQGKCIDCSPSILN